MARGESTRQKSELRPRAQPVVALAKRSRMTAAEQSAEFERVAREHGADVDDGDAFDAALKILVRPKTVKPQFTNGETKTLRLFAEGMTDHDISARLKVAQTTVYRNIENSRRKTGAKTREDLIRLIKSGELVEFA